MRCVPALFATAGVAIAILSAPVAAAVPECTNTGPTTTMCTTNGSAQITTSPPAMQGPWYGGWPVFGFGGFAIGW